MTAKRPITATFTRYVGFNRKPADVPAVPEHYFVAITGYVDGESGIPREVTMELSAAQIVMLMRTLPTSVLAALTGIDRRQFMRAAGMSNATIAHVLGTDVSAVENLLRGNPWQQTDPTEKRNQS